MFMPAVFTFNPGKTEMVIPAVQIAVDHLHHIGPPESVFVNVAVIPDCCRLPAFLRCRLCHNDIDFGVP